MPFEARNYFHRYRMPARRSRARNGTILRPLAQFLAFSDMVVAVGIFLFGIGTLLNLRTAGLAELHESKGKMLQLEFPWTTLFVFACLLVAIWNLLCTMILFVGVNGDSPVLLRLWDASQSITLVYSTVLLWTNVHSMTTFHIGLSICLLVHKGALVIVTAVFTTFISQKIVAARRVIASKVHRV